MKILIVSLLRIGDLLAHNQLVGRIKKQIPGAEIHVLINDFCREASSCIPGITGWHIFPRTYIQEIVVKRIQSTSKAELVLEEMLTQLNGNKFDLILDCTHNRQSVAIMKLLDAKEKRGTKFGVSNKPAQRWSVYLNEIVATEKNVPFQLIDALSASLGFSNSASLRKAHDRVDKSGICLQVLTSDQKKNWSLRQWKELIIGLQLAFPLKKLTVLCAPAEIETIKGMFATLNIEISAGTFLQTKEFLASSELLITGDTSIQHLAASAGCPILSLFLGGADVTKTAPYCDGAYLLKSLETCQPCWHSDPCSREQHFCSINLQSDDVLNIAKSILNQQHPLVTSQSSFELLRTRLRNGKLLLEYVGNASKEIEISFERELWSLFLEAQEVAPVGFTAHRWVTELIDYKKISRSQITHFLKHFRESLERHEDILLQLQKMSIELSRKCLGKSPQSISYEIDCLKKIVMAGKRQSRYFSLELTIIENQLAPVYSSAFTTLTRLKPAMDFVTGINNFRCQLLTAADGYLLEKGENNVSRDFEDLP